MSGVFPPWSLRVAATCAVAAAMLGACGDETSAPRRTTYRGPQVAVGAGMAWTEAVFGSSEELEELSVVFDEGALRNLPPTLPNTEFIIPMPTQAPTTVYRHIGINWQPSGHPPSMVYTVPHFDVHYYLISMSERDAMTPADPTFAAKAAKAPPPGEAPPNYRQDPMAIPRMGSHWGDSTANEHHGSPFTSTMIYGFYDGRMIFIEPMMSKAFLESKPNETKALKIPAKYPAPGRYPTSYSVAFDPTTKEYRVSLLGMQTRD
ncbi:MAG: DUF5602 domain-containing protein [Gemmatimonadetes bacterium]|nr:DUF5602 domain-containing protein [Gemmatimonadota bacterium]